MRKVWMLPVVVMGLSACQSGPIRPDAQWLPWNQARTGIAQAEAPQACIAHSRLHQPQVSGKVINSPHYTLITLESNAATPAMGELCIHDKVSGRIEITAIADLQFLSTLQHAASATPATP